MRTAAMSYATAQDSWSIIPDARSSINNALKSPDIIRKILFFPYFNKKYVNKYISKNMRTFDFYFKYCHSVHENIGNSDSTAMVIKNA